MKKITEKVIEIAADSYNIFHRGKRYYNNGRVTSFKRNGNIIKAKVKGGSFYDVKIDLADLKEGEVNGECSCPYPGYCCKHIVAVLFKLMEANMNLSVRKDEDPFKNLKFKELISNQKRETIFKAFDILNRGRIKTEKRPDGFGSFIIKAHVEEGGRMYHTFIEGGSEYEGLSEYEHNCSCSYIGRDIYHPCQHILAVYLSILKKEKPREIPVNYVEKLKNEINREKYMEFLNLLSERSKEEKPANKNKYKLVFEIEKKFNSFNVHIKKSILLKDGKYGSATYASKELIEEMYPELPDLEKRIIDILSSRYSWGRSIDVRIEEHPRNLEFLKLLRELSLQDPERVVGCFMPDEKALIEILIKSEDEKRDYSLQIKLRAGPLIITLNNPDIALFGEDKLWAYIPKEADKKKLKDNLLVELETDHARMIKSLARFSGMNIKQNALSRFIEQNYSSLSKMGNLELPEKYKPEERILIPRPRLFLKDQGSSFYMELKFLYGDNEISYGNDYDILFKNEKKRLIKIKRNRGEEEKILQILSKYTEKRGEWFVPIGPALEWLFDSASELIVQGFEIFGQDELVNYKISNQIPYMKLEVKSGIDWFDLKADVEFGKEKVPFENILDALKNHERFVRLSDGKIGSIPKKWLSKIAGVIGFFEKGEEGRLKAARSQIKLVESLMDIADKSNCDKQFRKIQEKFRSFDGIKKVPLPNGLMGELRPYQKAGYDWLHFLKEFSLGGCLADEMGLGKTLQIISLLLYEKEKNDGKNKTSLVVVPTSLVFNWVKEIEKFAPSLKVYIHHGQARLDKLNLIEDKDADVIIITYGILQNDLELFKGKKFYYVILDESQKIKNPLSKNAKSTLSLKSEHRIVLTGTPVENNLLELWSQFSFLNPGLLGNMNYFKEVFMKNIERSIDSDKTTALKNLINPFLLMRKKEVVAKDLPEKQVMTLYCEMEGKQREFYDMWKEKYKGEIKNAIRSKGFMQSKMKIIEGLTRLRQICNHPLLIDESFTGSSSKFRVIVNKVEEAMQNGHNVLLFSSFVKMLHLFREYFEGKGIKLAYLDGATRNRESVVREFQENPDIKLFLISIKAGGLNLNLTAADYVFIVDPWWNPAVEMQAMDRTHRIGQDKNIFVYKTIMKDSVEEKILELQNKKMDIAKNVIVSEQGIFKQLNREDIQEMFS